MTSPSGSALCACGNPATASSIRKGKRRCLDCSLAVAARAALEMHARSGPAWEAWKTSGGADTLVVNRRSPRFAVARDANLAKARAANERRRAAKAGQGAARPVVEPAPVSPPSGPCGVPAVVFLAPW